MVKVQDFIKFLKRNFGIKITKDAYHTYGDWYFLSDEEMKNEIIKKIGGEHERFK
uniref:Uncharacterized protein n=1 Tax=viral metagenome TaxID=1070528 RepID=A0A6M3IHR1_9ZZZZ